MLRIGASRSRRGDRGAARDPRLDQIQLARLKKRKLRLKDEIAMLEDLRCRTSSPEDACIALIQAGIS
jgi:hypothetical protein